MKNKLLLSTRNYEGYYSIILPSIQINHESNTNEKTNIIFYKKNFFFSSIFFVIYNFFLFRFFSKEKIIKLKYKGYNIGRYTVPIIFKNYKAYLSKIYFLYSTILSFIKTANLIESSINYLKNKNISVIFIDHCMYENGLIMDIFLKGGVRVYTLGYPRGIFYIDGNNKKTISYEDVIKFKRKTKLNKKKIINVKKFLKKVLHKTNTIPWMKHINFTENKDKNFKTITHVVYLHSFTDAQLVYGYDGFLNTYDWAIYTIEKLIKNKKNKILIKAHPSFFHKKYPTNFIKYDQLLCQFIIKKYSNNKNVFFLSKPIKNFELLKQLNKKTILISHHGSAILEGVYLKFKCISSEATFWEKKLKVTNIWKNKDQYEILLNKKWKELNFASYNDFYDVTHQLYCNNYGVYGNKFWQEILSKKLKIKRDKIFQSPKETLKMFHKKKNRKIFYNIHTKISQSIEGIYFK